MCSGNKDATQILVHYGLQDLPCKKKAVLKNSLYYKEESSVDL